MGVYFRRRVSFGPFALNFSTKGVGISTGVKGARLSIGPTGTFVHLGRGGFYYREKIGGFQNGHHKVKEISEVLEPEKIESADIKNFQNSSSDKLLREIREKNALIKYSTVSLICSIILFIVGWNTNYSIWLLWSIAIASILSYSYFFNKDVKRKTVTVIYELDKEIKEPYLKMNNGFHALTKSHRIWRIETKENTDDWKRNAGASSIVNRKTFQINKELPPFFDSNLTPFNFNLDNKKYYFFPDRILVYQGKEVGMVRYSELEVSSASTRFIEDDGVPDDSEIVTYTWRFVNKDGGPDRRFNSNRQIPIVLYSEIDLQSYSGLHLKFHASNMEVGETFSKNFENIINLNILEKKVPSKLKIKN